MDVDTIFQPRFSLAAPHWTDYFGLWMVHDGEFLSAAARVQNVNVLLHLQESRQSVRDRDRRLYEVTRDGIAQIEINGPMMKAVPSMGDGTSTVLVRRQLAAARRDPEVSGAMLLMDTPGGTAKGNEDLSNEVAAFAGVKPIFAYIEDMTASAGVSVASQTAKRFANNGAALYGAMGTYAVIEDLSGRADQLGIKVHVIKAGQFKGMGEPGTQITEEQIAELQRIVNRVNESYLGLIARGLNRSRDSILPLADGRIILAADAVQQGLLDGIQSYDDTYAQLLEAVSSKAPRSTQRRQPMNETPATLAELKATFPHSTAEWRESQIEAEATLSEAAIAYARHVEEQAAREREQHAKDLEAAKSHKPGASPLGHQPLTMGNVGDEHQETGDAVADFDAAVRARLPRHREASFGERREAVAFVARTKPALHRAYLAATNQQSKKISRLLEEKFEGATA